MREILTVIIGVLIAIQLDRWWNRKTTRDKITVINGGKAN